MKKTILVVEDDPRLLNLYRLALEESFNIILACNGKEAVDMATVQLPDLILMDVIMPEMDGLEAVSRLKGNPATAMIPVIFLTAKYQYGDILDGYRMGADYYITKPLRARICGTRLFYFLGRGKA